MPPLRFGLQLWSQATSWEGFRDHAIAAEDAGWDDIWTWDHLLSIFGPWDQPLFEGWSLLAAVAAVTKRVEVGLMVGANTFRNPGLTAKLAVTLDHISGGRAVLGIGGAWFEREHDAYGIDFGSGFGERLDRLDEAVGLIRRLLDGERIDQHGGRHYRMHDALLAPRPVRDPLPILIGGSGPSKTLRTTARYADAWNTSGWLDEARAKVATLEERCAEVGRDPREIERTISFPIVIRDTRAAADRRFAELLAHNRSPDAGNVPNLLGSPEEVADAIRPYVTDLGFSHVIVRMPAPYDRETIERMAEVRERLAVAV
jgi:alkanesulfonate monooxygenase SsuD/methylene tetrahydromethanopterin reductase-like flavin-dependent oxidoreductase (luciferase family)